MFIVNYLRLMCKQKLNALGINRVLQSHPVYVQKTIGRLIILAPQCCCTFFSTKRAILQYVLYIK